MGAIVVTGVPGVGKTTVMTAAAEAKKLKVVVYGTEMFEVAKARRLAKDRDELRKLAPEVQRDVQREAATRIAKMGEVIVDTHCTVKTPKGFLPGLPLWVLEALRPTSIVLVEADPKEIWRRRQGDASRARDPDTVEDIARHQELNRAAAMAYAMATGATVKIVFNHDQRVNEAIQQILPVVQ
jgi:adenylate kinase